MIELGYILVYQLYVGPFEPCGNDIILTYKRYYFFAGYPASYPLDITMGLASPYRSVRCNCLLTVAQNFYFQATG
jgi:hypothetical protein